MDLHTTDISAAYLHVENINFFDKVCEMLNMLEYMDEHMIQIIEFSNERERTINIYKENNKYNIEYESYYGPYSYEILINSNVRITIAQIMLLIEEKNMNIELCTIRL